MRFTHPTKTIHQLTFDRALAADVTVTEDELSVELAEGRTIAVPVAWFPRLCHATNAERRVWRLIGRGRGIHWPNIDEDISIANLLAGKRSGESKASLKKWLACRARVGRRRK